jgi:hypothetical protein
LILAMGIGFVTAAPQPALPEQLLEHYYIIQKSLASDSLAGISAAAAQISKLSRAAAAKDSPAKPQLTALANAAAKLEATDLKSARNGFGYLSDGLIAFMKATQAKSNPPFQFYCAMVKKNWLQTDKQTRNPYYGSSMLTCGELVQSSSSNEQPIGHAHH